MNLKFPTRALAQARANKMHADMIASNPLYAESAALYDAKHPERGGTARWAVPFQLVDEETKVPKDAFWRIVSDERSIPALSALERTELGIVEQRADVVETRKPE